MRIVNIITFISAFKFLGLPDTLEHGGYRMKTATEMLGARIREQRKRKKITQEQLAEMLGIDQKHMSRIELGKSYPSLDRLIKIAETLEVPLPSLFEFMHMVEERELLKQINEMVRLLGESDQRRVFKIVKAFLDG
jgi:transcriptional regulator with XRE-family HTH domain